MVIKYRTVPEELRILRSLHARTSLSEEDGSHYSNLEKGYAGELKFDLLTESLQDQRLTLNDLLLQQNGTFFQNDSIILSQEALYLFEIKNYEGEYFYENEKLYMRSGKEVKDPILQLARNESLLRQMLQSLGYKIRVEAYVVFVNPEFTLLQAPFDYSIIRPTQLNRFFKKLNIPSRLNGMHYKLAEKLCSLHYEKNPFPRKHDYSYERLKKGGICLSCGRFLDIAGRNKLVCGFCGKEESIASAILRNVDEIRLLFPDNKITTNCVHEWFGGNLSKKMIGRVLKENYKAIGNKKYTFYE